jgi:hypothetical protein
VLILATWLQREITSSTVDNTRIAQWEEGFDHLVRYASESGDALVPSDCVFEGFRLGQWVTVQRQNWDSLSTPSLEVVRGVVVFLLCPAVDG